MNLLAARWMWWCMLMIVLVVVPSSAIAEDESDGMQRLGFTTVTFDLKNGVRGYSSFLTRLRNAVEAPTRACGLQSTRRVPLPGRQYVLVNLKISNTEWVTLGIDAKDLYVWGYQDNKKYNGRFRATFLGDAPQTARNSLFPGSTRRITRYGGNYNRDLQPAAGTNRRDLLLGIINLESAIRTVYGKQESVLNQGRNEARFFIIAIQMVAEAARFKFMERGIVGGNNTPAFKAKMVAYQNDWDPISQAIHRAEAAQRKCTAISPTLVISSIEYGRHEVRTVAEIKNEMGILKYKSGSLSFGSSIMADNGDTVDVLEDVLSIMDN